MAGKTKDERYIVQFYRELEEDGDFDKVLNRYSVGESIGFSKRPVNTIVTLLMQANFLKKEGKEDVTMTKNGVSLVEQLLKM